jgi:protein TonB
VDRHAYALRVRALVEASKRYPARARRQGQEGEVTVRLRIAPDGRLLGQPRVIASSGAEALDREAVRMVHRAEPFPPSGAATAIELVVPVRFSLSDR